MQNGKFAGGVERSFTSTTTNPAVALDYAGSGPGSIFVIDFEFTSRAASVGWLSQYPHEEELLWPPCLGLSVIGAHESPQWQKKLLIVSAQVSTAKPDTNELLGPRYVPGTAAEQTAVPLLRGSLPCTSHKRPYIHVELAKTTFGSERSSAAYASSIASCKSQSTATASCSGVSHNGSDVGVRHCKPRSRSMGTSAMISSVAEYVAQRCASCRK